MTYVQIARILGYEVERLDDDSWCLRAGEGMCFSGPQADRMSGCRVPDNAEGEYFLSGVLGSGPVPL